MPPASGVDPFADPQLLVRALREDQPLAHLRRKLRTKIVDRHTAEGSLSSENPARRLHAQSDARVAAEATNRISAGVAARVLMVMLSPPSRRDDADRHDVVDQPARQSPRMEPDEDIGEESDDASTVDRSLSASSPVRRDESEEDELAGDDDAVDEELVGAGERFPRLCTSCKRSGRVNCVRGVKSSTCTNCAEYHRACSYSSRRKRPRTSPPASRPIKRPRRTASAGSSTTSSTGSSTGSATRQQELESAQLDRIEEFVERTDRRLVQIQRVVFRILQCLAVAIEDDEAVNLPNPFQTHPDGDSN